MDNDGEFEFICDESMYYKEAMRSKDFKWHGAMKSEIRSVYVIKFRTVLNHFPGLYSWDVSGFSR